MVAPILPGAIIIIIVIKIYCFVFPLIYCAFVYVVKFHAIYSFIKLSHTLKGTIALIECGQAIEVIYFEKI